MKYMHVHMKREEKACVVKGVLRDKFQLLSSYWGFVNLAQNSLKTF